MSGQLPLPDAPAVVALLDALTGAAVSVHTREAAVALDSGSATAEYVLDDGNVAAVAVLSLPLAVAASAALGLVPQPSEAEVKAMDAVPEHLVASLRELANVFAQLLNSNTTPHVRLGDIHAVGSLTGDGAAIAAEADRRVDLTVELAERQGTLTFAAKSLSSDQLQSARQNPTA